MINKIYIVISIVIVIAVIILMISTKEKEEKEIPSNNKKSPKKIILDENSKFKKLLDKFDNSEGLMIPLGFMNEEQPVIINLEEIKNLLVIGTTGGGKSICLNEIIAALAMKYTKEDIKIVTMDTSIVELSSFNGIPHYLKETICNPKEIIEELENIQVEIQKNTFKDQPLLVILDDYYDIYSYNQKSLDIIENILEASKTQKIHIILTTDTPTDEILTSRIKELIEGKLYLTLAPGEINDFSFEDELSEEEKQFLSKIGNLVYKDKDKKIKITIPEITDEEIKLIKESFNN